jgi:hypothetical protein
MPTNPIQMQSSDAVAEVTAAMKYRKPEFIAYMTRNSTSHELIELLILLTYSKKASCTDRQLLIYQNTSDEDLAAKIYTMLHKNSFWNASNLGHLVYQIADWGLWTFVPTYLAINIVPSGISTGINTRNAIKNIRNNIRKNKQDSPMLPSHKNDLPEDVSKADVTQTLKTLVGIPKNTPEHHVTKGVYAFAVVVRLGGLHRIWTTFRGKYDTARKSQKTKHDTVTSFIKGRRQHRRHSRSTKKRTRSSSSAVSLRNSKPHSE